MKVATRDPAHPPQIETIADESMRVQSDVARGGAIIGLDVLEAGSSSGNLIDNGDLTGRSVQASLYDGQWGPDFWPCPGGTLGQWGYNPVQEGDACQTLSGGAVVSHTPTSIVTSTTPRQWNAALGASKITLTQTLTIAGPGILRIDYTVTNHEAVTVGAGNWHELPCVYLNPRLTLGAYIGANGHLERPAVTLTAFRTGGEPWVAVSDQAGWTVALYAPADHPFSINFGTQPGKETTLLQAWQWLELAPEQTGTSTAWLIVGHSLEQVRQRIGDIR